MTKRSSLVSYRRSFGGSGERINLSHFCLAINAPDGGQDSV